MICRGREQYEEFWRGKSEIFTIHRKLFCRQEKLDDRESNLIKCSTNGIAKED